MANSGSVAAEAQAVIVQCTTAIIIIAAPKVLEKVVKETSHANVRSVLSTALRQLTQLLAEMRKRARNPDAILQRLLDAEPSVQQFHKMMGAWKDTPESNQAMAEQARVVLSFMGVKEPAGGWAAFQGGA
jgi:hypothetical protein